MRTSAHTSLADYYNDLQKSHGKLFVENFVLEKQARRAPTSAIEEPLEHADDSRLEAQEAAGACIDDLRNAGRDAALRAENLELQLFNETEIYARLAGELSACSEQTFRLRELETRLLKEKERAKRAHDARLRREALSARQQRAAERQKRLAHQREHDRTSVLDQERLHDELGSARARQARAIATEERETEKRNIILQILA